METQFWFDESWQDCLYCEGLGFVAVTAEDESTTSFLLAYNGYKKMITDIMDSFGTIISYKTIDKAQTVEIAMMPKDRARFNEFAKRLLKFGHYNNRLGVELQQVFFYEPSTNKLNFYWRISLKPDEIKDLDGFVDFIRTY